MKKTNKDSWFEVIPSNRISKDMYYNDLPVEIIQIEALPSKDDSGIYMLCEIVLKKEDEEEL